MLIESKLHKQINGNIEGEPFDVVFDSDGRAGVEEVVGNYLLRLHAAKRIAKATEEKKVDVNAMTSFSKPFSIEAKSLSNMSLSELKVEASRLNIKLGVGKTQKQIIAKIEGGK